MVADRHRLAAYHIKHCWRAFRGYQHRWPWTTLNPKNMGFKWIFCYFKLWRTLWVNFRWNILEIDQDSLRTKLNWCCHASHEHKLKFLVTIYTQPENMIGNQIKWIKLYMNCTYTCVHMHTHTHTHTSPHTVLYRFRVVSCSQQTGLLLLISYLHTRHI